MLSERARQIIKDGSIRVRVKRAGMLQFQIFTVKKVSIGNENFVELFLDRVIDLSELNRLAEEFGLPIETQNGRAFPKGTGANDFILK